MDESATRRKLIAPALYGLGLELVPESEILSENVRKQMGILQKTIAECDALKQAILRQVFE